MFEYAVKRFILSFPTVFAVVLIVFALIHLAPGNPSDLLVGENASVVLKKEIEREYALDKPLPVQALYFFKNLFFKGGGKSIYYNANCFEIIGEKFKNTLFMGSLAFFIGLVVAFSLAFTAFRFKGTNIDKVITFGATVGMSIPSFWLGILLLLLFAVKLRLFPVAGTGGLRYAFLPALTLSLPFASYLLHIIKGELADKQKERFVLALKTRGIGEKLILLKHILKSVLSPVVTVVALQTGFLLTGAIITETIFSWDGIGLLLINAINFRDYPLVQSLAIFIAVIYIYSNLFGDILIGFLDRRISFEKKDI